MSRSDLSGTHDLDGAFNQAKYDAQEYARKRQAEYPNIGDQLDDLYHKGAFSDEMAAKIKAVKDAHPKPE